MNAKELHFKNEPQGLNLANKLFFSGKKKELEWDNSFVEI